MELPPHLGIRDLEPATEEKIAQLAREDHGVPLADDDDDALGLAGLRGRSAEEVRARAAQGR